MKNFINWQNIENYKQEPNIYDPYQGFIRGNIFPNLYNQYKITRPYEIQPMNEQAEILTKINALEFSAHDLNLYLDNFPNDNQMINYSNELNEELKTLKTQYEKNYGPLLVNNINEKNTWQWNKKPWPWEN